MKCTKGLDCLYIDCILECQTVERNPEPLGIAHISNQSSTLIRWKVQFVISHNAQHFVKQVIWRHRPVLRYSIRQDMKILYKTRRD